MVEGRLEMCVDGVWGIALYSSSSIKTANVACRQLGFSAKGFTFYHIKYKDFWSCNCMLYTASRLLPYSPFGDGDGPIVYSIVHCHGNEKSLFDCRLSPASSVFCISQYRHWYTLSIRCTDGENWTVTACMYIYMLHAWYHRLHWWISQTDWRMQSGGYSGIVCSWSLESNRRRQLGQFRCYCNLHTVGVWVHTWVIQDI